MKSAVCTLFEKDYHLGVAALVNSLYKGGFRGVVWAGYRGDIPPWAHPLKNGEGYKEFNAGEGCSVRFIQLKTGIHFTNYKPGFMRELWADRCSDVESLFYFDPDIVIKCRWAFFEEWVSYGIALCEDVNSPIHDSHPLRTAWKRFFGPKNFDFKNNFEVYFNAGFIGITADKKDLLEEWDRAIGLISFETGDLAAPIGAVKRPDIFSVIDQDAMNVAVMCTPHKVSAIGKEGMDIVYGGYVMSHALGPWKPWQGSAFLNVVKGRRIGVPFNEYWKHIAFPIRVFPAMDVFFRKIDIFLAKVLQVFIKRG